MELDKKIDEYSEELFVDLGLTNLPEEKKAEIYARLEDHLHQVILDYLKKVLDNKVTEKVRIALEQEDYRRLASILKRYQRLRTALEEQVQKEFDNLKAVMAEELKHAGQTTGTSAT